MAGAPPPGGSGSRPRFSGPDRAALPRLPDHRHPGRAAAHDLEPLPHAGWRPLLRAVRLGARGSLAPLPRLVESATGTHSRGASRLSPVRSGSRTTRRSLDAFLGWLALGAVTWVVLSS